MNQNKLCLCFALSFFYVGSNADTISGSVVGIADGDTVTILDANNAQHKIRLAGIDAPEKKQAFGNKSKENLSNLIFNKSVQVETTKRDKYEREIGKIVLDGVDINLQQIKDGFAWHYRAYQRDQSASDRSLYSNAEEIARASKIGLWADATSTPPWVFRKTKQLKKTTD